MATAFNLRTRRQPLSKNPKPITIVKPNEVSSQGFTPEEIRSARKQLWETLAGQHFRNNGLWIDFPGVQSLREVYDTVSAVIEMDDVDSGTRRDGTGAEIDLASVSLNVRITRHEGSPKVLRKDSDDAAFLVDGIPHRLRRDVNFEETQSPTVEAIPTLAARAALVGLVTSQAPYTIEPTGPRPAIWVDLAEKAKTEEWSLRLGEALLLFKYALLGQSRPLTEAADLLRACWYLESGRLDDGLDGAKRARNRNIEVPEGIAYPANPGPTEPVDLPRLPNASSDSPKELTEGPSFLRPSGRSDLLLVETIWNRYEHAEIAEIVTVLEGETRTVRTTRTAASELDILFETFQENEEEVSESTDNRASISTTAKEIIKKDLKAAGSVQVTSQGATVTVNAKANASIQEVREKSEETVGEFAKNVTRRAEQQIRETTKSTTRRTTRTTIKNEQESIFDGDLNTTGIYRHIDLVSDATVKCFGVRTLYDIIIPEPAALIWHLAVRDPRQVPLPEEPSRAVIDKPDIVRNVGKWRASAVESYGPIDFEPEPSGEILSTVVTGTGTGTNAKLARDDTLVIPDGLHATSVTVKVNGENEEAEAPVAIFVSIGIGGIETQKFELGKDGSGSKTFDGDEFPVRGEIGISVTAENFQSVSAVITVETTPDKETIELWRIDTYGKIVNAYRAAKASWDQQVLDASSFSPAEIVELPEGAGTRLQEMMRAEVQRFVLAEIRNEHLDDFELIREGGDEIDDFPQPDLEEIDRRAPEIKFLQQAFEWEEMSWVLYPHLWGRTSQWRRTILEDHANPDFAAFIRSGAARVQLPVRPGFEELVAHYMETKEVYPSGLPRMGDAGFLPFIDEQLEAFGAPGTETEWPSGAPLRWEVRQPTELVVLQEDNTLPKRPD